MIYQVQKKIQTNFPPLQVSCQAAELNSVPSLQTFFSGTGEYVPDYTLTPLGIMFECSVYDPSGVITAGSVNASLANVRFYEVTDAGEKQITADNKGYVVSDGEDKGKIQLKKNAAANSAITVRFEAEYLDPRTGQLYKFRASKLVRCMDASEGAPSFTLDKPTSVVYNPLRDPDEMELNAVALFGNEELADEHCKVYFYKLDGTGNLVAVADIEKPNEIVSAEGRKLVVNRAGMGGSATYVAKLVYNLRGEPEGGPDALSPMASCTIRRVIPKLDVQVVQGFQVAEGTMKIYMKPVIMDAKGVIPDPTKLSYAWYRSTDDGAKWTKVSEEREPLIDFTPGMMWRLVIDDLGAGLDIPVGFVLVTDTDGSTLTDTDGVYIVDAV